MRGGSILGPEKCFKELSITYWIFFSNESSEIHRCHTTAKNAPINFATTYLFACFYLVYYDEVELLEHYY